MSILNFLIITTLIMTTFIRFNKSIATLDCTSKKFQKKLSYKLTNLVKKQKSFQLPIRCSGRAVILGKIKGNISNE
jgi:5-bromo-4-chloroindolyl phosphate hydrolysis protein